jgi:uncharacterized protein (TIRG00374 family)
LSSLRPDLGTIARLLIGFALLGLLYYQGALDPVWLLNLFQNKAHASLAILLLFATVPLSAVRWHILLRAAGHRQAFSSKMRMAFIANFFNVFLPGLFGSDFVRATLAVRGAHERYTGLALSVIADRLIGLGGLIILGAIVVLCGGVQPMGQIAVLILPLLIGYVMGIAIVVSPARALVTNLMRRFIPSGQKVNVFIEEVSTTLRSCSDRFLVLCLALALSVMLSVMSVAGLVFIAAGLGSLSLPVLTFGAIGTLSLLANAIPLTPVGIGVGELAFIHFAEVASNEAVGSMAMVFLGYRMFSIMVGLTRLVPFILSHCAKNSVEGQQKEHVS